MHLLAANWGWFLALAAIFVITAVLLQVRNMRTMVTSVTMDSVVKRMALLDSPTSFGQPAVTMDSVVKRMAPIAICGVGALLSGILFLVGVVANLMGK